MTYLTLFALGAIFGVCVMAFVNASRGDTFEDGHGNRFKVTKNGIRRK